MKNKIISICLLFLMFSQSLLANTTYTVTLNGIIYETSDPVIEDETMMYISLSDLTAMTLMSSEVTEPSTYLLKTANGDVELRANGFKYTLDNTEHALSHATFLIDEELYLPVSLLEDIGYTSSFDLEKNMISLTSLAPYSRNPDSPDRHIFKSSQENLKNLPKHTIAFSSQKAIQTVIDTAIEDKTFLSFASNHLASDVDNYFTPRFDYSPYNNMFVTFRKLNTYVSPNVITETVTLPLKVNFSDLGTQLTIGDEVFNYPMFWATFYPAKSLTDQDITKTAETTIMRGLYEYYRNAYDLRDDKYFSPFATITSDRTNVMAHGAYSLALDETESHYDVVMYRVHPTGAIHYIIDLIAK